MGSRDVAGWLDSPEGTAWSRSVHDKPVPPEYRWTDVDNPTWWRTRGEGQHQADDPCGAPPITLGGIVSPLLGALIIAAAAWAWFLAANVRRDRQRRRP